jgi:hypothetical protein
VYLGTGRGAAAAHDSNSVIALHNSIDICSSCATPLTGRFCSECGERRIGRNDQTVRHFVRESVADVTTLDGKLLRTLRALLLEPGELTREFMAGRRVLYMRPLQLFLLANLVYFVVHPYTNYTGYITPLASQMDQQLYSKVAGFREVVERDVARRDISMAMFEARFDAKTAVYAKSLVLLMVPLFALVAWLLHVRERRPAVQHLVFAAHFYAWELMVVSSLFLVIYSRWLFPFIGQGLHDLGVTRDTGWGLTLWILFTEMPSTFLIVPYLAISFRRVYTDSWAGAVVRSLLCVPLLLLVLITYRYLLFWVTLWTV